MHRLFLGLFMLPLICAMFGFVAHRGRAVDFVSWFFLAAFYVALWWFRWEVTQLINAPATGVRVGSVTDPLEVLLLAVATGFGFWRWKQASDPTVADTQELP
jgi:L-lactate permease